jgi:hypothetical protein
VYNCINTAKLYRRRTDLKKETKTRKTIQFPDHDLHRKIMVMAAEMSMPAPEVIRKGIELLKKQRNSQGN